MTLSLVGTPTAWVIAPTSIITAFPSGYTVTADDLAVVVILSKHRTETTTPSTPAGWTQFGTGLGGVTASGIDQGRVRLTVMQRVLAVGVTAPTIGQTSGTGNVLAGCIYVWRKSAAGTYATGFNVLSEATSTTSWSEVLPGVPDWLADDQLVLPAGATTDSVTGFASSTLTATGLTVGTIVENIDTATTQGDDARVMVATAPVSAGPPSVAPTRAITLSGVASTGVMGVVRVRHVPAPVGATVGAAVVPIAVSIPLPSIPTPAVPAAFRAGVSMAGGIDLLGFGASVQVDATAQPVTVAARATVGVPSLWGPPSGLTATPLSTSVIRLTWSPVTAIGYDIERDGTIIAVDHPSTQYDDTGLSQGTEYDYRVRASR